MTEFREYDSKEWAFLRDYVLLDVKDSLKEYNYHLPRPIKHIGLTFNEWYYKNGRELLAGVRTFNERCGLLKELFHNAQELIDAIVVEGELTLPPERLRFHPSYDGSDSRRF